MRGTRRSIIGLRAWRRVLLIQGRHSGRWCSRLHLGLWRRSDSRRWCRHVAQSSGRSLLLYLLLLRRRGVEIRVLHRRTLLGLRLAQSLLVLMIALRHVIVKNTPAGVQSNTYRVWAGSPHDTLCWRCNEALSSDVRSRTRSSGRWLRTVAA